ncbi:MAG: lipopolysaccharide heptosyltransferase II [Omnitrophica WOR_2 bacterium RIFCSPLOWO2_12_FULL_51_8]|nr:MAG: lipopolysaccharide heptosyltransferase II [Omnitrophica WOR_2 bacterium RIFCSPLOWO2_12_FULL_51_8]
MIDKILFITLSNIGDVILTLPVLDCLATSFPQAEITVIAGPRAEEIFRHNPRVSRLVIYHKRSTWKENFRLFQELKKEGFTLVVDLRNTLFGLLLPAKYRTAPISAPKSIAHMRDRHLHRLLKVTKSYQRLPNVTGNHSLWISRQDEDYIQNIFRENNITSADKIIVVAPGARSQVKRWPQDKFAQLPPLLEKEFSARIILAGDKDDLPAAKYINAHYSNRLIDLCGKTSLTQLAQLLKRAACVLSNDSAVLHLSSYLNIPTVAIFGPTDEAKYGPWSEIKAVVKKEIACRPCEKAQCRFGHLNCLHFIKPGDVLRQVKNIFDPRPTAQDPRPRDIFKRILIVRTDRIGDVLLSTPVINALREAYPSAYIAMMVSPQGKDIVDGNPYLDEAIIYDKEGKHRGWARSWKFAQNLKKKRFELALVLHPTNRVHLVTFLAAIPRRVGYDRKMGFLLTERLEHKKQLGQKHELEYSLDLVRHLGIEPQDKAIFMPLRKEAEIWAAEFLRQQGVKDSDKLLLIHPGASCPSKIWPPERFAQAADRLAQDYGLRVVIVAGPKDIALAKQAQEKMHQPAINLAGKTSLGQLAGLLKRCRIFICNDSGPMHIAAALEVPVIAIFGRAQDGLSPRRWGPLGKQSFVLHKDVGCIECLAHNCVKQFTCLQAITVNDIVKAAASILVHLGDTPESNRQGVPGRVTL